MRVTIFTTLALVAFAANSLLCRAALGGELVDPVSFTTIRICSGALVLAPLGRLGWLVQRRLPAHSPERAPGGSSAWISGALLFAYAIAFSLAYASLDTGMGALILFGSVQATMLTSGLASGERPLAREWFGLVAALGGLAYLVWPGIAAPDVLGALSMAIAGTAWGVYSLRGRRATAPILATRASFARAVPLAAIASTIALPALRIETRGALLAIASGSITSGIGYVLWYSALRGLTSVRAAIVQLLVPVLAAAGGVLVLDEIVSLRLAVASALILGGVALAVSAAASRRVGSASRTEPLARGTST